MDRETRMKLTAMGLKIRGVDADIKRVSEREVFLKLGDREEVMPMGKAEGALLDKLREMEAKK